MIICANEEYKGAAEFYAEKLGIPEDTIIAIGIYPQMPVAGYCEFHEEEAVPYFLIGIEENPEDEGAEDPISVLAHEMVHVKQYVNGELIDYGQHCSWKGVDYREVEADTEDYYFSPWEVEAFGIQVGLYRLYCRSMET